MTLKEYYERTFEDGTISDEMIQINDSLIDFADMAMRGHWPTDYAPSFWERELPEDEEYIPGELEKILAFLKSDFETPPENPKDPIGW